MNNISDKIRREGDLSGRSGQLARLHELADKVAELESLALRHVSAEVYEVASLPGSNGGFGGVFVGRELVGKKVRLVVVDSDESEGS